jgi:hypothetical protein
MKKVLTSAHVNDNVESAGVKRSSVTSKTKVCRDAKPEGHGLFGEARV